MAAGYLKVIALGNLGENADLKFGASGMAVLTWSMACTTSYWNEKKQERIEQTEWVDCVIFGKRAEALAQMLTKGKTVFVEGSLRKESWEKDGKKQYRTKVYANEVIPQGGGAQREQGEPRAPAQRPQTRKPPEDFGYSGGKPVVGQTGADYGDGGPPSSIPF